MPSVKALLRLLPYYRPYRGNVAVGLGLVVISSALASVVPLFLRRALDGIRAGVALRNIWLLALAMVALSLVAGGFAGTSFSCGWAAVSPRFAIARSRPRADVSRLSALAVSCFELSALHAPSATTAPNASGATKRPIYFAIDPPSMYECGLTWALVSNCRKNNNLVLAYPALKGKPYALGKGAATAAPVLPPL